jgi:hypothetical protein
LALLNFFDTVVEDFLVPVDKEEFLEILAVGVLSDTNVE